MLRYAPRPAVVVLGWLGALAALGWALGTTDAAGRLLAVTAVGLLGVLSLVATVARPRLAADRDGLLVGRLRGAQSVPWPDVQRVEAVRTRRFGLDNWLLELDLLDPDGTERLVVLSRLDLGADPVDVAAALRGLGHRAGG